MSGVLPLCAVFCSYVVCNNISLLFNSVTIYQLSKILCTPFVVLIEWWCTGRTHSRLALAALIPVCLGFMLAVIAETSVSAMGIAWASAAVMSNALYTVWGGTKQKELQTSPQNLLLYQSSLSTLLLLVVVPVTNAIAAVTGMRPLFEDLSVALTFPYSTNLVISLVLSAVLAVGLNASFFIFVGKTSPLTTNVLGYFKTCVVFLIPVIFERDRLSMQVAGGVLLTLAGLALFTFAKLRDASANAAQASAVVNDAPPSDGAAASMPASPLGGQSLLSPMQSLGLRASDWPDPARQATPRRPMCNELGDHTGIDVVRPSVGRSEISSRRTGH
eukprot:TRINITY_DN1628_c0_g1_i1.p1 TRINITY_DN1628_c0_g1~~TRINITY_DN1628_c0_g1_i1.p1  ORF type:complete len:331 (+),score=40.92 TRINITY_DN1628_c0_g1_i1:514-1506(+)